MDTEHLYDFLLRSTEKNYIIKFVHEDSYRIADIDFAYSTTFNNVREEEPLDVDFDDCIGSCNLLRLWAKSKTDKSIWEKDGQAIGVSYEVEDILSIYDDDKEYFIYEKH